MVCPTTTGALPEPEDSGYVKKFFDLSNEESLITLNGKVRPVILLSKNRDSWWNPTTNTGIVESWNCLPLFSYKDRHTQSYVLSDQKLETERFYVPPFSGDKPGIHKESAAIFSAKQSILVDNIKPLRHHNPSNGMSMKFKISDLALKLIVFHNLRNENNLRCFEDLNTQYEAFKDFVTEIIDSATNEP
jgi:hypothetical protein